MLTSDKLSFGVVFEVGMKSLTFRGAMNLQHQIMQRNNWNKYSIAYIPTFIETVESFFLFVVITEKGVKKKCSCA